MRRQYRISGKKFAGTSFIRNSYYGVYGYSAVYNARKRPKKGQLILFYKTDLRRLHRCCSTVQVELVCVVLLVRTIRRGGWEGGVREGGGDGVCKVRSVWVCKELKSRREEEKKTKIFFLSERACAIE